MSNEQTDIFVYKIIVDNGGAPCVWKNMLSLAICKPKIRKAANSKTLIFGFGGKDYQEKLIYIASVTDRLENKEYYTEPQYSQRPDCIYEDVRGKAKLKESARYHNNSDHTKRDVGEKFQNAFVLLSKDFRYFGDKGSDKYKSKYPVLGEFIENLTQGHRRNHSDQLRKELLALKKEMWSRYSKMKIGSPTDKDFTQSCNQEAPSAAC